MSEDVSANGTARRLVLVGGGPASAAVLIRLAELVRSAHNRLAAPVEITLIDRDGETGGGDPHGARTSPALLLGDKLAEIDGTGIGLTPWLHSNRNQWIGRLLDAHEPMVDRWLETNHDALARTDFAGLYLPRIVFGDFIREQFVAARRLLARSGVSVNMLSGEVTGIRPVETGWHVLVAGRGLPVHAQTVLLAVGSLGAARPAEVGDDRRYFSYSDARDVANTRGRLLSVLARHPGRPRLAVLGSSAAASEVLYCLEASRTVARSVGEVVVVSPSGRLADGVPSAIIRPYQPRYLPELVPAPRRRGPAVPLNSEAMIEALRRDVLLGRATGYTMVDMLPALRPAFSAVMTLLPNAERRRFVEQDSIVYQELIRHAPPEYASAAIRLARRGQLTVVRGRVAAIERTSTVDFAVRLNRGGPAPTVQAAAVFDCRGFARVADTVNPAIRDLVDNGVATANSCGRGLRVNEHFEAADGLYVLGPALAGLSHGGGEQIWSLEYIPRIHTLAGRVAGRLWNQLFTNASPRREAHHGSVESRPIQRRPRLAKTTADQ
jgi:uncharacterized NAD(P)/FAD-binding protein YdhS